MDLAHYFFQNTTGTTSIGNSLRFRGAQDLTRTNASTGNTARYTLSVWLKAAQITSATNEMVLMATNSSVNPEGYIGLSGLFQQRVYNPGVGTQNDYSMSVQTLGIYRDPSAWYHYCFAVDTTAANVDDRARLYINGTEVSVKSASGGKHIDQGSTVAFTEGGETLYIGKRHNGTRRWDGYMSEFHFVDGQFIQPTEFGETNDNGVWVPRGVSIDDYGTNGFYLDFSDPDDIGADRSGNGNNWTATGFELTNTASRDYDWMADSPTQNYATMNPLDAKSNSPVWYGANQGFQQAGSGSYTKSTILAEPGSKLYCEYTCNNASRPTLFGVKLPTSKAGFNEGVFYQNTNGNVFIDGVSQAGGVASGAGGVGVALDLVDDKVSFYVNNTLQSSVDLPQKGESWVFATSTREVNATTPDINSGTKDFVNALPAGFEPLQSQELPAVSITDPSDHFEVITDTGANILTAAQAKFPNGLWWIKDRVNVDVHKLVDSVRGGNLATICPVNASEYERAYAAPAGNSVAWCWALPAATVTNNDGNIETTVAANKESGFSCFTYTGSGSNAGTVGHGLDKAPEFVIQKKRTSAGNGWDEYNCYHVGIGDAGKGIRLNSNGGAFSNDYFWNRTTPTDKVIRLGYGGGAGTNGSGSLNVIYCWHSVPGYSAFGSYTGNYNANGPFVYTGFKPKFVLIKATNYAHSWVMFDGVRSPYNLTDLYIYSDDTTGERENNVDGIDLLSNGFKIQTLWTSINDSAGNFIYAAFADSPFGGSNISPTTAR